LAGGGVVGVLLCLIQRRKDLVQNLAHVGLQRFLQVIAFQLALFAELLHDGRDDLLEHGAHFGADDVADGVHLFERHHHVLAVDLGTPHSMFWTIVLVRRLMGLVAREEVLIVHRQRRGVHGSELRDGMPTVTIAALGIEMMLWVMMMMLVTPVMLILTR